MSEGRRARVVGALFPLAAALRGVRNRVLAAIGGKTVGVRMAVFDAEGRVCLIRHTYGDRAVWALPGGAVDLREEPREAAIRECREEAGIERMWDVRIVTAFRHTLGGGDDVVVVYASRTDCDCHAASPEIAEARWFDPDALPEPVKESVRTAIAEVRG